MTSEQLTDQINENLDRILQEKQITRYKLMKDTGISINRLYSKKKRDFSVSTILKICNYLEIPICQLISNSKK